MQNSASDNVDYSQNTETLRFLSYFSYDLITLQLLKKAKPLSCKVVKKGQVGSLLPKLVSANDKGAEIFFMVNAGDGEIKPGKKIPRSQENVTHLKACFIDTDSAPFSEVKDFLKAHDLKPHLVVESSPKKYHVYFLLEETEADKKSVWLWSAIQEKLAEVKGTDQSMTDHAKVLRLPGFKHLKDPKAPFRTRIVLEKPTLPKYTLQTLAEKLNVETNPIQTQHKTYTISETKVSSGSRHQEMTAFLGHVLNTGIAPEIAELAFQKYAEQTFENPKEWLPKGSRYNEVQNFISWKLTALEKEKVKQAETLLTSIDSDNPSFYLPDDFYFKAPGLIGEIVQEISEVSRYPIPPFVFAAAIAALGTLKSKHVSSLEHYPSNYFLCLAPSGTGKNEGQRVIHNTISKLGLKSLISSQVRSSQGLLKFMQDNASRGLISLDEAQGFFASLDNNYAQHYIKQCRPLLMELYTASGYASKSFGKIAARGRDTEVILTNPVLNVLAYGVLNTLETAFNKRSIEDGLLPRFIILTDNRDRVRNHAWKSLPYLNGNILDRLKELAGVNNGHFEEMLAALQDTEVNANTAETEELRLRYEQELEKLKVERNKVKRVKFTPDAVRLYEEYSDALDKRITEEKRAETGLTEVFTRTAEQIGRLAVAIADTEIDKPLIDYLITFMDSRIKALYSEVSSKMEDKSVQSSGKSLLRFIAERMRSSGSSEVPYSDIARYYKVRSPRELKELLEHLTESEQLKEIQVKGVGRPGKKYALNKI